MFKLTIMYRLQPGQSFDVDYYINHHMPLSLRLQGDAVRSVLVEKGYSSDLPGTSCEYAVICHFTYETEQAFLDAFLPNAETLQGDIPKFTDSVPIIQFSNVLLSQRAAG
ncbi:MAG: EthD family reductase [Hyphomonas sp.]